MWSVSTRQGSVDVLTPRVVTLCLLCDFMDSCHSSVSLATRSTHQQEVLFLLFVASGEDLWILLFIVTISSRRGGGGGGVTSHPGVWFPPSWTSASGLFLFPVCLDLLWERSFSLFRFDVYFWPEVKSSVSFQPSGPAVQCRATAARLWLTS